MCREIKEIAAHIRQEIQKKFSCSTESHLAVGGFIFLRFLCPAIIFPHQCGIDTSDLHASSTRSSDEEEGSTLKKPDARALRGLVLISKFLQNLANGTSFHAEHEKELNTLIADQTQQCTNFLQAISTLQ